MRRLISALAIWLALTGAALAQCTGGISGCPAATSVNVSTTCTVTAGNTLVFTNGVLTTKGANCT